MEDSNNLENLLNELNTLQQQFNNLQPVATTSKTEKENKQIKTDLVSKNIDTDFFNTISAPLKKDTKTTNNIKDQNPLFTLDKTAITKVIKKNEVKPLNNTVNKETHIDLGILNSIKKTNPKKEELKNNTVSKNSNIKSELELKKERITTNFNTLQNTITNKLDTNLKNEITSSESYLSIKQKLNKIKADIALREDLIKKESEKVKTLKTYSNYDNNDGIIKEEIIKVKNELSSVDKIDSEIISIKDIPENILNEKKEIKNALSPTKNKKINQEETTVKPTVTEINTKTSKQKKSINLFTISIILLAIILIMMTAWFLLK